MFVARLVMPLADLLVSAEDKAPKDADVKAGGWGALVVTLLIVAVVVLLFSFTKQLRKAQAAKDAGVYGDDVEEAEDMAPSNADVADAPENHSAP